MINFTAKLFLPLVSLIALLSSGAVLAHDGASLPYGSFMGGLTHPVLGLDHFLAMVSVGVVSAQIGGRAVWTVPLTFVLVMLFGGLLGWLYVGFTAVEVGIAISVLALGFAIAADQKLPVSLVMTVVGFFAIFHGYAHGAEMPTVANPYTYAAGFMAGTAVLHILGLVSGDIARHYQRGKLLLRFSGGAIASVGAVFFFGAAG
ncbi:MAG: HupE/UreJ family protein [Gammaproteobacteria bacterium]|nr:HupE/UreJ family protein [Gammaproteobacteria bacterium]MCP4088380.1 HupE/UreJ family protein [Gammaproteobacteria bacterium]MCP4275081.1 HupE/UreJ family protein [Gammaproteobacteria bacterium]MCP4830956.1 HupE/UreJ family protein [Gammaproteobacteria bacterium]MCP4927523.1 HupE/UreJ family protein [Gammaproteobacteria bacterium]